MAREKGIPHGPPSGLKCKEGDKDKEEDKGEEKGTKRKRKTKRKKRITIGRKTMAKKKTKLTTQTATATVQGAAASPRSTALNGKGGAGDEPFEPAVNIPPLYSSGIRIGLVTASPQDRRPTRAPFWWTTRSG